MHQALYRKYRSKNFDDLCGQDFITAVLRSQAESGKLPHAFLFCGTRGTGKTSTAKILAKAVNCENPSRGNPCGECGACISIANGSATDVLEIDAASNNRVADVRELIDEMIYPPTYLKKRVYIIDEVHMLTDSAFNALLKTLEEPPEYVIFILATTELRAIPATIVSRCLRFDFKRIEPEVIASRIKFVCESEKISIDDESLSIISRMADGSLRDALSLLEAAASGGGGIISAEAIRDMLGIADRETIADFFAAVSQRDISAALAIVGEVHRSSKDLSAFVTDMIGYCRDVLVSEPDTAETAKLFTPIKTVKMMSDMEETLYSMSRYSINKKTALELLAVKLCCRDNKADSPESAPASAVLSPAPVPMPKIIPDMPAGAKDITDALKNSLSARGDIAGFLQSVALSDDTVTIYTGKLGISLLGKETALLGEKASELAGKTVRVELAELSAAAKASDPIDEIML